MKSINFWLFLIFAVSLFSCDDSTYDHWYEKAFFLGEDEIIIDGTVFPWASVETPREFKKLSVKTKSVEKWEIEATNKGNGQFEFLMEKTANGITISNETIDFDIETYTRDPRIIELYFYLDDGYKQNDPCLPYDLLISANGVSKYTNYDFCYVTEAMDLSEEYTITTDSTLAEFAYHTYHLDLNFSKPGWYKIVRSDTPINDDPKYSTGENTRLR